MINLQKIRALGKVNPLSLRDVDMRGLNATRREVLEGTMAAVVGSSVVGITSAEATDREFNQRTYAVDARHTGFVDTNHLSKEDDKVTQEWEFDIGDTVQDRVTSSPALVDGTLYFGSWNEHVYAVDADDGTQEWRTHVYTDVRTSPAVVDGMVYVGAGPDLWATAGHLYALDAETGTIEWEFEPQHADEPGRSEKVGASPVVVDGTVYVGTKDSYLYALDADSGEKRWEFDAGGWVKFAPAVTSDTVYVPAAQGGGAIVAVNRSDGTERWRYDIGDWTGLANGSPTVSDGRVIVGVEESEYRLLALGVDEGEKLWTRNFPHPFGDTVAVTHGSVYVHNDELYALDPTDGSQQWMAEIGSGYRSSPLVVGDIVIACGDTTYAVDAGSGDVYWSIPGGGGGHVAVGADRIYVPELGGKLYGYSIVSRSSGEALSGVAADYDADGDGEITVSELLIAADDYAGGDLSLDELADVAAVFAAS